jgi:hypothetical protein
MMIVPSICYTKISIECTQISTSKSEQLTAQWSLFTKSNNFQNSHADIFET